MTSYLLSACKAMADREKMSERRKYKIEYIQNEKSFLDETKNIFSQVLKDYHLVKKRKRADSDCSLTLLVGFPHSKSPTCYVWGQKASWKWR